ncbi:MAG: phosphoribosylanthranilate isomerase [Acidaminococcales bacterium]|nr:phosphoribosylanthranilate isomerase [Acidaminococcales bacterium]
MGRKTKIKICGAKTPQAAFAAQEAGADFIGVIFADSARRVDVDAARRIREAAGSVLLVGVFKDQPLAFVLSALERCGLDAVQLHGSEPPEWLDEISLPVFRSVAVRADGKFSFPLDRWRKARAFVFDRARADGASGGAGTPFCWRGLELGTLAAKAVVAGGLTPGNVGEAIKALRPCAVDVAGGVEINGEKSPALIQEFIKKAREADSDA